MELSIEELEALNSLLPPADCVGVVLYEGVQPCDVVQKIQDFLAENSAN